MKTTIKILIVLSFLVSVFALYWTLARYTNLVYDEMLEPNKWGNVTPFTTFLLSVLTILILGLSLKYYKSISNSIDIFKTIKIGISVSIPFILLGTLFWSDSWSGTPNFSVPDARELGDGIFSIGHPLTFLVIDLTIYLRHKFNGIEFYWSDYWAYPTVVSLFIAQTTIYIQGMRIAINMKKIKTAYSSTMPKAGQT